MIVEIAAEDIIPEWLELAKELEPLFESPMAGEKSFDDFMITKISRQEAYIIKDGSTKKLLGLITISHEENHISWLGVFHKYRKSGVGTALLRYALEELDDMREVAVTTFREDNLPGIPARRLYQKFGFIDADPNYIWRGLPRSRMIKPSSA
jgi:ribosomal protein S18 acetylase RimI-like enzyme